VRTGDFDCRYEDDDFSDPWGESDTVPIQHGFGRNVNYWRNWVAHLLSIGGRCYQKTVPVVLADAWVSVNGATSCTCTGSIRKPSEKAEFVRWLYAAEYLRLKDLP